MKELKNFEIFGHWETRSQAELVEYIIGHYHKNAIKDLVELIDLAKKVEKAHHGHILCPTGLSEFLGKFQIDLEEHLLKEEEVLFPIIKNGQGKFSYMPIKVMQEEHKAQLNAMMRFQEISFDYEIPDDACKTWRRLSMALKKFEVEMREHIFLEDKFLFARTLSPNQVL